uniref:F-box domain-containing protein n=1 Tax=Aegilops tauschii subsp. strangulata TaxID=200361 RepID=A0A453QTQ6_AEGTS
MGMQPQTQQGGGGAAAAKEMEEEPHVERLPADLLAHVLSLLSSFHDLAMY